jgi:hypothetical protein
MDGSECCRRELRAPNLAQRARAAAGRGRARGRWLARAALAAGTLAAGCSAGRDAGSGAGATNGTPLPHAEHYAHSIAAIGYPGARRAFQIGSGAVVSSGDAALEWSVVSDSMRTSPIAFQSDGVPIAHVWQRGSGFSVEYEAAAAPPASVDDTTLTLSVCVRAAASGSSARHVVLRARVQSAPAGPHSIPWDAAADFHPAWKGNRAWSEAGALATLDPAFRPAAPMPANSGALTAICDVTLAPHETRSWYFTLPLHPAPGGAPAPSAALHARACDAARKWWRATLDRAASLSTPDSLVNALWRASLVTLVQCHERERGHWIPIGNPFQYRDVWVRDAARLVRALGVANLADFVRDDARALAAFQLPGGAILSQRGQIDGTGEALWAFEQAVALAPAGGLARDLLPCAARAFDWIARQRLAARVVSPRWPGLLPFGDPHDGELVRAQLTGNDAWGIAGCDAMRALAASGSRDVPPSWQGVGRDWGNTSVAYPTFALSAGDPRVAALARRVFARGADGLATYGTADSLHTYLGADLAQSALLADRPADARHWLDGILAHSSSTLGQAEMFDRVDGGFGINLPPHGTASAVIVDLLRNMLVSDDRDTLGVALGAPARWWSGTVLERAATRFGAMRIELSRPAPDRMRAVLTPVAAPLRVRVPDGVRAAAAITPGVSVIAGRWIEAPPRTAAVEFAIVEEPSAARGGKPSRCGAAQDEASERSFPPPSRRGARHRRRPRVARAHGEAARSRRGAQLARARRHRTRRNGRAALGARGRCRGAARGA